MLAAGNTEIEHPASVDPTDITIGGLLAILAPHGEKPLIFFYGGRPIRPGYHVTEVKAGQFSSLDCGANPESWAEVFVQLWDVGEDRTHMSAGKFSAIIGKVTEHVALAATAKLTFEVSGGNQPMQLYCAALPEIMGHEIHVNLSARRASCKPRDRWLNQPAQATSCCGKSATGAKACCGN